MPASAPMSKLPRLQDTSPAGIKAWANDLVSAIELQMRRVNATGIAGTWSAAGYTPTRAVTGGDGTANALATLVADLTTAGVIP